MSRVLVTGISGAGKSTILDELRRRSILTVDTGYDGWELSDGTWDESRIDRLLTRHQDIVVPAPSRPSNSTVAPRRRVVELADAVEGLYRGP